MSAFATPVQPTSGLVQEIVSGKVLEVPLRQHVTPVVETVNLMAEALPRHQYVPMLTTEMLESGALSALQYEAVACCGFRHSQVTLDASGIAFQRAGFFLGDATGVGKGRTIAAIIVDNFFKGRLRSIWVSCSRALLEDAKQALSDIGITEEVIPVYELGGAKGLRPGKIKVGSGVIFVTFNTLGSQHRMDDLVQWLQGCNEEGLIVFDECHKAKNLVPEQGRTPTKTGLAVLAIQEALPQARIVYASATGMSTPNAIAPFLRLNLWGKGAAFRDFNAFVSQVRGTGYNISAQVMTRMEIAAREFKAEGAYISRSLSYAGAEFRTHTVSVPKPWRDLWDQAARWFIKLLKCINRNERVFKCESLSGTSSNVAVLRNLFWACHQRFFKLLLVSLKVEYIVQAALKAVEDGLSPVIALWSTGEAAVDAAAKTGPVDSLVSGCGVSASNLLLKHMNPDTSVEGSKCLGSCSPNYVEEWKTLLEEIMTMGLPPSPLDELLERLGGPGKVAELSGRSTRLVDASFCDEDSNIDVRQARPGTRRTGARRDHATSTKVDNDSCGGPSDIEKDNDNSDSDEILDDRDENRDDNFTSSEDKHEKSDDESDDAWDRPFSEDSSDDDDELHLLDGVRETYRPSRLWGDKLKMHVRRVGTQDTAARKKTLAPRNLGLPCANNVSAVNNLEKELFQKGEKLIAIITGAASSGVSLHASNSCKNQRRRLMIVAELAWSADVTIQQLGRIHRSNQVNPPLYELVVSEMAGENRFLSAVSSRLKMLGALTKADCNAAMGSENATLINETYFGECGERAAARLIEYTCRQMNLKGGLGSFRMQETLSVPSCCLARRTLQEAGPMLSWLLYAHRGNNNAHERRKGLRTNKQIIKLIFDFADYSELDFRGAADEALQEVGINSNSSKHAGKKLLAHLFNRLMGVPSIMQNNLFSLFQQFFKEEVEAAKLTGTYDDSTVVVKANKIMVHPHRPNTDIVHTSPDGIETKLSHYRLDYGVSFAEAMQLLRNATSRNNELRTNGGYESDLGAYDGFYFYKPRLDGRGTVFPREAFLLLERPVRKRNAKKLRQTERTFQLFVPYRGEIKVLKTTRTETINQIVVTNTTKDFPGDRSCLRAIFKSPDHTLQHLKRRSSRWEKAYPVEGHDVMGANDNPSELRAIWNMQFRKALTGCSTCTSCRLLSPGDCDKKKSSRIEDLALLHGRVLQVFDVFDEHLFHLQKQSNTADDPGLNLRYGYARQVQNLRAKASKERKDKMIAMRSLVAKHIKLGASMEDAVVRAGKEYSEITAQRQRDAESRLDVVRLTVTEGEAKGTVIVGVRIDAKVVNNVAQSLREANPIAWARRLEREKNSQPLPKYKARPMSNKVKQQLDQKVASLAHNMHRKDPKIISGSGHRPSATQEPQSPINSMKRRRQLKLESKLENGVEVILLDTSPEKPRRSPVPLSRKPAYSFPKRSMKRSDFPVKLQTNLKGLTLEQSQTPPNRPDFKPLANLVEDTLNKVLFPAGPHISATASRHSSAVEGSTTNLVSKSSTMEQSSTAFKKREREPAISSSTRKRSKPLQAQAQDKALEGWKKSLARGISSTFKQAVKHTRKLNVSDTLLNVGLDLVSGVLPKVESNPALSWLPHAPRVETHPEEVEASNPDEEHVKIDCTLSESDTPDSDSDSDSGSDSDTTGHQPHLRAQSDIIDLVDAED